ncbi:MAG TPA: hypothetical protein VGG03_27435 [Thermoanaerobaculia bacterium]|jgi:hypothetical protein
MNSNRRTSLLACIALALAFLAGAVALCFEVPLTVVLSPEGKVEALWNKPLSDGEAGDVVEIQLSRVSLTERAG